MARRFDAKLDSLHDRFEALKDSFASTKDSVANAKVWALLLYITLAAGVFGTLARSFGWI